MAFKAFSLFLKSFDNFKVANIFCLYALIKLIFLTKLLILSAASFFLSANCLNILIKSSFGDLKRESYIEAEERVVKELKELNKPFVIVLNTNNPYSDYCKELANTLTEKYNLGK